MNKNNTFTDRILSNKKLLWGLICLLIIITGAAALLIIKPWEIISASRTSGEADAVMTTKAGSYNGMWSQNRYSDELYYPIGIALKNGNLIVADSMCDRIQIFDGEKNKRVGKPGQYGRSYLDSGALVDGYREAAMFMKPSGVAVNPVTGDIIVADTGNNVIRRVDDTYVVTISGNGKSGYSNGREGEVQFNAPSAVVVDDSGIIYVADTMNHCIRKIDSSGNVTLFAGTPQKSGYRDGEPAQAQFFEPYGLAIMSDGSLLVADAANHCIRKISNGEVTTIAGKPGETDKASGYPRGGYVDGENSSAMFNFPRDVALMPDGGILVADSMNNSVRLISDGSVRTLVGNGAPDRYYGSSENLKLTRPMGVCTDGTALYISDTLNNTVLTVPLGERVLAGRPHRERMLEATGISTSSKYAYNGDIRVYIDDKKVDMGRVKPWNTPEAVYVPIRPLFEALGASVALEEKTGIFVVSIGGQDTKLTLDKDYFILKGTAVTTIDEIVRLFPYYLEWFEEFGLIALHIPSDLAAQITE